MIKTIPIMGTSGLRLTQENFNKPLFLEQFLAGVIAYFATLRDTTGNTTVVIGGDPRLGNANRVQTALRMLLAQDFKVVTAQDNVMTTPAISGLILDTPQALGGIIFTASHNPYTDVGIKINDALGRGLLESETAKIHVLQNKPQPFTAYQGPLEDGEKSGILVRVNAAKVYGDFLDRWFDFKSMRKKLAQRPAFKVMIDGMGGAAGPFVRDIFLSRLGFEEHRNITLINCAPDPYLGGHDAQGFPKHPEPDFAYLPELIAANATGNWDLVAGYDSDGDRRLDGGSGFWAESADEFAALLTHATLLGLPAFFEKTSLMYIARSAVTSATIDLMEESIQKQLPAGLKLKIVQTPTGFKYISPLGNLGVEESNGMGNPMHGEKDGIAATLMLLKVMVETGQSVKEILETYWQKFGRIYFTRGEITNTTGTPEEKQKLATLFQTAHTKIGQTFGNLILEKVSNWVYIDPLTQQSEETNVTELHFSDGHLVKARFSGTGSGGYCLRVYASKEDKRYNRAKTLMTQPMKDAFDALLTDSGFPRLSDHWTDTHQPDPYGQN